MDFEQLQQFIIDMFGAEVILGTNTDNLQPYIILQPERLPEVCLELHDNPLTYFDLLSCVTGIDNGPEAGTMEVAYNLYSIPHNHHLMLKVQVQRNNTPEQSMPAVPTVSHIWRTADWHEREIFDLLGIYFTDHPDMRRILCAADWEGHPLRKDYKLQDYYHGIKVPYDQHNENSGFRGEPVKLISSENPFTDKREKPE
ncbi:NADH-quinone oxidoreductase subunit C [Pontibacter aydingkolensis]|uniref:NADH-quinone oxidoreductase subunit C n=1 Tax=Pontibacter aydingkolensis TaxID=1911536 RepID=A0ABS7CT03_9BACT|nr:NADH-quinone oxidoreductase subunit C [Pontibacter aydingkolensis]MBW7466975.1 NADH-quinone oxidoreductase subunit C [Pontibacter aydingkolensis]